MVSRPPGYFILFLHLEYPCRITDHLSDPLLHSSNRLLLPEDRVDREAPAFAGAALLLVRGHWGDGRRLRDQGGHLEGTAWEGLRVDGRRGEQGSREVRVSAVAPREEHRKVQPTGSDGSGWREGLHAQEVLLQLLLVVQKGLHGSCLVGWHVHRRIRWDRDAHVVLVVRVTVPVVGSEDVLSGGGTGATGAAADGETTVVQRGDGARE